jgi:hypothetical protein
MEEEAHFCVETLLFLSDLSEALQARSLTPENQRLSIAHEGRVLWETRRLKELCQRLEQGS